MRTVLYAVMLMAMVGVASAGEIQLANLPGADFTPGQLRLPLIVTERSGVERKGAVVTSGVPFPPGFLADAGKLGVVDKDGKAVPCQAAVTVKWNKPAYDDSAQWVMVSFPANCPANGTATYYLVDNGNGAGAEDGRAAPAHNGRGLTIARDDKQLTVGTGVANFTIPLAGDDLISQADIGGEKVIGNSGLRTVITTGDWPDRGLKLGDKHVGRHESGGVTVEEPGENIASAPARVVVCIKGTFAPGDKDGRMYGFTTRLYFEANSPAVRIIHTINNSRLDGKLAADGTRHIYMWPIKDASLVAGLAVGEPVKLSTLAEGKLAESSTAMEIYQDSSGGQFWQDLPRDKNGAAGNYEQWLSRYTKGLTVRGVTFRGYRVLDTSSGLPTTLPEGKELAAGNAHLGVLDISGERAGLTVAKRNFRVEYPSAISGSAGQVRVGLFPGEFSEPFHLDGGQRKSWDVRLTLHGGKPADADALQRAFAVQDTLFLFRPAPAWMVRAGANGAWPYGIALNPSKASGPPRPRMDKDKRDGINAGWDWFGWLSGWNSGGSHWNEETVLMPWVLYGDGANFDAAEANTLWAADMTAINYDHPDQTALWMFLMSWNDKEARIKREGYPGYYSRDTWGLPDSGHMGMMMYPEYYFVTGDMRVREVIEHLGERARAMLWQYNHDDKADGTGPMHGPVNWCKKRDPDADPDFRLFSRYVGWPLFDLANYYRFTGDPAVLAECRTVARAFRNTARYSPIGFMCLEIEPKGGRHEVYAFQGPKGTDYDRNRDLSASACYANFQMGLMTTGLIEYYLMSRDGEALDAMTGFADCLTHHAMIRDPAGKQVGWTYVFADYWGPYKWEDCLSAQAPGKPPVPATTWHTSNFVCVEDLGWIYQFIGRKDYAEAIKNSQADTPAWFSEEAAVQALLHPKLNDAAPQPVQDLKAEPAGGGKVKLTWTAPGSPDNGKDRQANRYVVKYSTARIVELTTGWPDRAEPLPAGKKQWEDRAAAFNAKQRAFWSAQTAANPPVPQQAGAAESMTIDNLAPGKYYFAIKSFNHADNLSELSNVVEAEVK